MPYLIDGHNLIPKIAGFSLTDPDDEMRLVQLLQRFALSRQQSVEVFFDRAAAGHSGARTFGRVTARFMQAGRSADSGIARRLKQLKGAARNWKVVTSDRQVQAEARSAGAEVVPSDEFARTLQGLPESSGGGTDQPSMGESEMDEWLRLFSRPRGEEGD